MPDIRQLLGKRNSTLLGSGGDPRLAEKRLLITKLIGENYKQYYRIRQELESKRELTTENLSAFQNNFINVLTSEGYIVKSTNGKYIYKDGIARSYLAGGWLEELIYCAMLASDVDEILFQQQIQWEVNGVTGKNEIDVIARKADILSFTSCKTSNWNYRNDNQMDRNRLKSFLFEVDYWDTHFADDKGRAILAISQDLIDEDNNKKRSPTIFARAEIMNVDLISLDYFKWDVLVEKLRQHWL